LIFGSVSRSTFCRPSIPALSCPILLLCVPGLLADNKYIAARFSTQEPRTAKLTAKKPKFRESPFLSVFAFSPFN
jgi:hypothetical protein